MGRTIPSYRIASEMERWKWRPFRKLLDKQDRKIFDEMLSIPRLYNAAGTMACRPVLINVILMSIIFEHYKQLRKIVNERICSMAACYEKKNDRQMHARGIIIEIFH
jgi:hypothetical protein